MAPQQGVGVSVTIAALVVLGVFAGPPGLDLALSGVWPLGATAGLLGLGLRVEPPPPLPQPRPAPVKRP